MAMTWGVGHGSLCPPSIHDNSTINSWSHAVTNAEGKLHVWVFSFILPPTSKGQLKETESTAQGCQLSFLHFLVPGRKCGTEVNKEGLKTFDFCLSHLIGACVGTTDKLQLIVNVCKSVKTLGKLSKMWARKPLDQSGINLNVWLCVNCVGSNQQNSKQSWKRDAYWLSLRWKDATMCWKRSACKPSCITNRLRTGTYFRIHAYA